MSFLLNSFCTTLQVSLAYLYVQAPFVAFWAYSLEYCAKKYHRYEKRDADCRCDQHGKLGKSEDHATKKEGSGAGGGDRAAHDADAHVLVCLTHLVEAAFKLRVHIVRAKVHDVVN